MTPIQGQGLGLAGRGRRRPRPDQGSGTVLMLVLVIFSGFLIAVTVALADAVLARHRAAAAADLAALAAAGVQDGSDGCAQAQRVASANAVGLSRCGRLDDGSVVVAVTVVGGRRHLFGAASAQARAGPGGVAGADLTQPPAEAKHGREHGRK
jgi:secretion/DNA translocation related TadE-like protein